MFVIRDFFSKKQKEPRTIQQFRELHNKVATLNCCIFLPKKIKSKFPVPEGVEITELSKESMIAYSITTTFNRYLQEKGIFEMNRKAIIANI